MTSLKGHFMKLSTSGKKELPQVTTDSLEAAYCPIE
jgi:hypothetical protein